MKLWNPLILDAVRAQYQCDWEGYHGIWHWENVANNAMELSKVARRRGVQPDGHVIHLFALFHDACRVNEGRDPQHGLRGGNLALKMHSQGLFTATIPQLEMLHFACAAHTDGATHKDPTIGICWDADRLDLPRVGVPLDERRLSRPVDAATLNRSEERALALSARVSKETA